MERVCLLERLLFQHQNRESGVDQGKQSRQLLVVIKNQINHP